MEKPESHGREPIFGKEGINARVGFPNSGNKDNINRTC